MGIEILQTVYNHDNLFYIVNMYQRILQIFDPRNPDLGVLLLRLVFFLEEHFSVALRYHSFFWVQKIAREIVRVLYPYSHVAYLEQNRGDSYQKAKYELFAKEAIAYTFTSSPSLIEWENIPLFHHELSDNFLKGHIQKMSPQIEYLVQELYLHIMDENQ